MTQQPICLSSVEDALQFLVEFEQNPEGAPAVAFAGELATLKIVVDGPRYVGTIPGELARGLWDFQEAIYKAAAFAIYGADDIRKLTSEQRDACELVFKVENGSTDLKAKVVDLLNNLVNNMSSTHKVIAIVTVALILTSGWGAVKVLESSQETKKEQIKAELKVSEEAERTKQLEIFARAIERPEVRRFESAAEEGTRAVMRGAHDATSVRMGRVKFNGDEIQEANQRAPKVKSSAQVVQEDFRIFGTESKLDGSTKYTLWRVSDSTEFTVNVSHDDLDANDLEKLWKAAKDRKAIRLEVNLTINRSQVRAATIVQVL